MFARKIYSRELTFEDPSTIRTWRTPAQILQSRQKQKITSQVLELLRRQLFEARH